MGNLIAGRVTQYKPGMRDPKTALRWVAALRLRAAGETYQVIAQELGYQSKGGAHDAVRAALATTTPKVREEDRTLELLRLDALTEAVWGRAEEGDLQACNTMLAIMAMRARLAGLDVVAGGWTTGGRSG